MAVLQAGRAISTIFDVRVRASNWDRNRRNFGRFYEELFRYSENFPKVLVGFKKMQSKTFSLLRVDDRFILCSDILLLKIFYLIFYNQIVYDVNSTTRNNELNIRTSLGYIWNHCSNL